MSDEFLDSEDSSLTADSESEETQAWFVDSGTILLGPTKKLRKPQAPNILYRGERSKILDFKYEAISIHQEVVETSLERLERKLDLLNSEVARKQDIIEQTETLLSEQIHLNDGLTQKLEILRSLQEGNVIHKRLERYSLLFLTFFASSFLLRSSLGIIVVDRAWEFYGMLGSFGFLVMSWLMARDWVRQKTK